MRRCKCCGGRLKKAELCVCEACRAAGFTAPPEGKRIGEEAVRLILERQKCGARLLDGMDMDTIAAAARQWNATGYRTYGRFRAYCEATGKLPPK